ncbi:MAG: gliding motility-associated C-terminal domain-containing protein, partial [Flavobacteriales bacterium]
VSVPQNGVINPENLAGQVIDIGYFLDTVCDVVFDWEIIINASPQISVSEDTIICPGTMASLSAAGADSYAWSPSALFTDPFDANPNLYPLEASEYQLIGTTITGCSDTTDVFVDLFEQPVIDISAEDSACFGDYIQLNGLGGISYEWTGEGISENNISNPILYSGQSQEIFLTGTDINGCIDNDSIDIYIIQPVASFTPELISGVSPLELTFTNQSDAETFYWNFGNGEDYYTNDVNDNPTIIYEGETDYTVMLVASSAFCKDTSFARVEVVYDSRILLFPNIVTNNGDGKNDFFKLLTQNVSELNLTIVNRWGEFIASIETPDGYWSAKESNDGTYFYTYTALGLDGRALGGNGYFMVTSDK